MCVLHRGVHEIPMHLAGGLFSLPWLMSPVGLYMPVCSCQCLQSVNLNFLEFLTTWTPHPQLQVVNECRRYAPSEVCARIGQKQS